MRIGKNNVNIKIAWLNEKIDQSAEKMLLLIEILIMSVQSWGRIDDASAHNY